MVEAASCARTLTPQPTVGVVALDFNRDGLPDLAAVTPQSVLVFRNPGGGMFSGPSTFPGGPPPLTSAVGGRSRAR